MRLTSSLAVYMVRLTCSRYIGDLIYRSVLKWLQLGVFLRFAEKGPNLNSYQSKY